MMPSLSRREILVLISGVGFLLCFFGYQLIVSPVFEKRETLKRVLDVKQSALKKMKREQRQYQMAIGSFDLWTKDLSNKNRNGSLFSFLDNQARLSGVKNNVAYMKPTAKKLDRAGYFSETVKLRLKEVYLKELVDFINRIETHGKGVDIVSLSLIKAGKNNKQLDVVMECQVLFLKDQD